MKANEDVNVANPTKDMPDLSKLSFKSGPEGLAYHLITKGDGAQVQKGQTAVVHYTGWLMDGKKFDSSRDRGNTFEFVLGQGRVIRGWELGVAMMKIGDRYLLKLPSEPPTAPVARAVLFRRTRP